MIENISKQLTANHKKSAKRPGRGISAGQGKTAGRGTKGQKSRAGHNIPNRFEGGQTVLSMRLPKLRGFKSVSAKAEVVSLDDISKVYKSGETISYESLKGKGLVSANCKKAKVLNSGTLTVKVKLDGVPASKPVIQLIEDFAKKTQSKAKEDGATKEKE